MRLIDLTHPIENGMPAYPGDPVPELTQIRHLADDGFNNHRLITGMHSGTHVDSPSHLVECKPFISELPLESFVGPACILDVRGQKVIGPKPEYRQFMKDCSIVLLHTGFDVCYGQDRYFKHHPSVELEFCELLLEQGIRMLGLDTPSPDRYPYKVHKSLLRNNVFVLENLRNLGELLTFEKFEVIAFPLKIRADSSLTRAVARVF